VNDVTKYTKMEYNNTYKKCYPIADVIKSVTCYKCDKSSPHDRMSTWNYLPTSTLPLNHPPPKGMPVHKTTLSGYYGVCADSKMAGKCLGLMS
jgi:hypothetical protein